MFHVDEQNTVLIVQKENQELFGRHWLVGVLRHIIKKDCYQLLKFLVFIHQNYKLGFKKVFLLSNLMPETRGRKY